MLYECNDDANALALLVLRIGVQSELVAPSLDTLRAASAMAAAHASQHLQQLIASMFTNFWWMLRGHHTPAAPQRGFMPGTALADLAFSLVYRLFLGSMQRRLVDERLVPHIDLETDPLFPALADIERIQQTDISWVDDTVALLAIGRCDQVIDGARCAGTIIFQELYEIGFQPNVKARKTQITPIVVGSGALQALHDCYIAGDALESLLRRPSSIPSLSISPTST